MFELESILTIDKFDNIKIFQVLASKHVSMRDVIEDITHRHISPYHVTAQEK